MEYIREVKKSFCLLSVAYIVIGVVLLIWPDISVRTFCYVFGIAMIIFGGSHLIMYFTQNRLSSVIQPDLVIGVVTVATGFYVLLKMEYMMEIIPFAMGIVALLGAIVKIQDGLDLKRIASKKWYIMLIYAAVLFVMGLILIINPFAEQTKLVILLIAISVLLDGIGNLIGIFWIGISFKRLKRVHKENGPKEYSDMPHEKVDVIDVTDVEDAQETMLYPETIQEGRASEEERDS